VRFSFREGILCPATLVLSLALAGCSGVNVNPPAPTTGPVQTSANVLTEADVQSIVTAAASSVNVPLVIAVSDRSGNILAVYKKANAPATAIANYGQTEPSDDVAAALARSAAYFSNDQAPISTRTVRFISASHFPPGVDNTESGPLYGIEESNRGCNFHVTYLPGQSLPVLSSLHGGYGLGIVTGKPDAMDSNNLAVNPGGVPIFKGGQLAGAIGVAGADMNTDEYAAYAGSILNGYAPVVPSPGVVVVGGIALPFVDQTTRPAGESAGSADGGYEIGPLASPGPAPEGDLIEETGSTQGGLTLSDVQTIVQNAIATGEKTRAVLRLPEGSRARFVIAVSDLNGNILALYRMPDATMFSVDVALTKSRNVTYFSSANEMSPLPQGTAITNRTIGFTTQPFFPSGITGTSPGPFFKSLFVNDINHPCTQGQQPANPYQSGIVFFPGSAPLYKNGKLVGGIGVSGDGVDQDDYVAAAGAAGFAAPANIRADNYTINGVPIPYQKFPRNPEQ
jgi:uncharacterized protein GlcG (DUF336 family)